MKWFFRGLVAVLMIGGWFVAARSIHLVRGTNPQSGQDRFIIVPKSRWQLDQTYVDVRSWTAADLPANAALVRQLCQMDKSYALIHLVPAEHRAEAARWLLAAVENPPATQPMH